MESKWNLRLLRKCIDNLCTKRYGINGWVNHRGKKESSSLEEVRFTQKIRQTAVLQTLRHENTLCKDVGKNSAVCSNDTNNAVNVVFSETAWSFGSEGEKTQNWSPADFIANQERVP